MRPQGSAEELERRRRRAVESIDQGEDKKSVARILGVQVRSVDRWLQHRRQRGDAGLAARPHPPKPSRLSPAQERQVLEWIGRSPLAFGFSSELWTAERVASLIDKRLHVHYHPRYLSRWLTRRGITPQRPMRRAIERNEQAIDYWLRHVWPRLKKGPGASVHGSW